MRLIDLDVAAHHGTVADYDIAVDGLDRAHLCVIETDSAVDRFRTAGNARTVGQGDAAVDRLDVAADRRLGADANAAIHGLQIPDLRLGSHRDAAVDRFRAVGADPVLDPDRTIDGIERAVSFASAGDNGTVDLVDILAFGVNAGAGGQRDDECECECGA